MLRDEGREAGHLVKSGGGVGGPHGGQVVVLGGRPQAQQLLLLDAHSKEHAIENVEVPLFRGLVGKAVQSTCKQFPEAAGPQTLAPNPVLASAPRPLS